MKESENAIVGKPFGINSSSLFSVACSTASDYDTTLHYSKVIRFTTRVNKLDKE